MMPNTSPDAPVLTLKEASQFLGLSIPTLYRLGKKGDIELIRVGEIVGSSLRVNMKSKRCAWPELDVQAVNNN